MSKRKPQPQTVFEAYTWLKVALFIILVEGVFWGFLWFLISLQ